MGSVFDGVSGMTIQPLPPARANAFKRKRLTLCLVYAYNSYMPYYDEVFKHLTEQAPQALAALALRTSDVEVGEKLSTDETACGCG